MKKSLIALAVAGAFAAPAFAATSNVDVYGIMNVALQDTDATNSDMQVTDNFSRVGFKGAEDLGGGLKAVWQIESGLGSGSDGMGTGTIGTRNTFVGLAGGFGTFLMGRHDTPYKLGTGSLDIFADTIGDYNLGRLNGVQAIFNAHDHRSPNAIAYISPTVSGFHAAIAAVATNTSSSLDNGDTFDAWSATGIYSNGPLFASLSYQSVDHDMVGSVAGTQDSDAWKVGVGYTFGDAKVGLIYEDVDIGNVTGSKDRTSWTLNGVYNMGPIALKASYSKIDNANFNVTAGADQTLWVLGADYALSKRTTAYLVYGNGDSDKAISALTDSSGSITSVAASALGDVSGWNIGVKHSF